MKIICIKVHTHLLMGVFIILQLLALTKPILTFAQESVFTYKDKKYGFEVNFPKQPEEVSNAKPILRKVMCSKSASLAFLVLVLSSEVGKAKIEKTVDEHFLDIKTNATYNVTGSKQFKIGDIKVIEWWGTFANINNLNTLARIFVVNKLYYQFQVISASEIVKDYSYPFLNSIKINGTAVQSDYIPDLYQSFEFDPDKYVSKAAIEYTTPSSGVSSSTAKVALVIGIKSYEAVPPLANTLNDARDIAASLKAKGFSVIEVYDPKTKSDLRNAVLQFNKTLSNNPNGVGMLYYSGHGMQIDGANYMIPAAATLEIKADVDEQCMNMDYVLRSMEENGNQLNIIVLDACRNNPFRSFSRSAEKGLSMVNAPKGSYIVYATKPGAVASDGTGRNGLFTSKLLKFLDVPDQSLEDVFKNVASEVAKDSNDQQRPWVSSDYTGVFYFNKK